VGHSIDIIDPAFAPEAGWPEAGGLPLAYALKYLQAQRHRFRGLPTW
jgi:arginase family enzyme